MTDYRLLKDLLGVTNKLKRDFNAQLEKSNVSYPQWNVLKTIKECDEKVTAKMLCELTDTDKATMSDIVKRLENKKLLKRKVNPKDRRAAYLFLGSKAEAVCSEVEVLENEFIKNTFTNLSEKEVATLHELIVKIYEMEK